MKVNEIQQCPVVSEGGRRYRDVTKLFTESQEIDKKWDSMMRSNRGIRWEDESNGLLQSNRKISV